MKKKIKHPKDMTGDELMADVFHPKALKHIKKHVRDLDTAKKKRSKRVDK